jgi:hypothetical protein
MAIGIDDALAAAAAGISLTDTVVRTVKAYQRKGVDLDIELLIEQVRITALERIDEADRALMQFEQMLKEKDVDTSKTLHDVIKSTPWWRPDQEHRLKRIRKSFNSLAEATYGATDDISALLRCRGDTRQMGVSVIESAKAKHDLAAKLLEAKSVKHSIDMLREELLRHKQALHS